MLLQAEIVGLFGVGAANEDRTRLVSTLMDVSRLEAGRLKGSFKLVNLGIMTRDLAVSHWIPYPEFS
jgi:hypothetical protein